VVLLRSEMVSFGCKCYGSALARAALTLIRLGLANLGYLSMRCFMFPTSFLSFV